MEDEAAIRRYEEAARVLPGRLRGLALSQWDSLKQLRGRRGQEASSEKDLEAKNAE